VKLTGSENILQSRVLLVEEDAEMARQVTRPLERAGMQCRHAADAAHGMKLFHHHRPQLVLLSLGLPHLGGVVLCPQLRAISTVPIAVLSVRTRKEDHLHALNLGADDFIVMRPFDEPLMLARILALLRRSYAYGQPHQQVAQTTVSAAPNGLQSPPVVGWVTCEACGYMGPQHRFEKANAHGHIISVCPHCSLADCLRFQIS
jgi:DNA-binding response OmpR family regulator